MTKEQKIDHIKDLLNQPNKLKTLILFLISQTLVNLPEDKLDELIGILENALE